MTDENKTESFEIIAAVLLGLAGVLAAWVTYQSGQWGGAGDDADIEADRLAASARSERTNRFADWTRDVSIDVQAKMMLKQAEAMDESEGEANLTIARYLYTQQMSTDAYEWLGLPIEYQTELSGSWSDLPVEALGKVFEKDLGDEYHEQQTEEVGEMFAEADAAHAKAQESGGHSDEYEMVAVILTIAMFFGGIAQVFKSRVRWPLLLFGAAMFAMAVVQTLGLPIAE